MNGGRNILIGCTKLNNKKDVTKQESCDEIRYLTVRRDFAKVSSQKLSQKP